MGPIIHIVDDDQSFRTAIGRMIEASGFRVALYESGEQFLAHLPNAGPGCILLDLQLPGLSGSDLQSRLAETVPLLPIIYLTGEGDIQASVRAIKAGAEDFLEKPASGKTVVEAIDRALLQYERRRMAYDRIHTFETLLANLTPREAQVFDLIVRGKLNKQIAYALGTSERTVKAHRHCVMEKLGARSLAEAVSIAERMGRLEPASNPPRHV
ncbi:FixJ family two-component response regulator [Rhizobium leguminosarum]|uniref:FixJ family two-component response regulator n=1 Tax=Rhizobium leguminosarum TaxID=384 RepID=A0AAE2SWI6_RHILE|nr:MULTISPECIES: response regulator transcription factor [Rhizobium]MBB4290742.1 FixJ family two-component response regulator [Rhizobium leguminosarum]MBB4297445.1 FixJ family two-component response regulator [Rhizobium leguminosarum]MBB4307355.1 FixJ family two-component response regulator [Rhizobium leguminosarum]MBB4415128.1 FixJ family two-component response regulator [Rhizobium leguminosarum]MBB4431905.1 FixJ family two-component response regulator [Rhizobium esperanzae]